MYGWAKRPWVRFRQMLGCAAQLAKARLHHACHNAKMLLLSLTLHRWARWGSAPLSSLSLYADWNSRVCLASLSGVQELFRATPHCSAPTRSWLIYHHLLCPGVNPDSLAHEGLICKQLAKFNYPKTGEEPGWKCCSQINTFETACFYRDQKKKSACDYSDYFRCLTGIQVSYFMSTWNRQHGNSLPDTVNALADKLMTAFVVWRRLLSQ